MGWSWRAACAHSDPAIAGVYIIMLTARVDETERIVGLELGADDYVTKPFSPRELVARVRAAVRRLDALPTGAAIQVIQSGALRLDPSYRTLVLDGKVIDLTSTEFDLLHHLMLHPGRPFRRDELLDVTQTDAIGDLAAYERTIDVHVKNLRQKLGTTGRQSRFIETVHGIGYRFVPAGD
jgi:two-component system alkaline phosphatase synthesis response regulator PhoP